MDPLGQKKESKLGKALRGIKRIGLFACGLIGYGAIVVGIGSFAVWGLNAGGMSEAQVVINTVLAMLVLQFMTAILSW